MNDSISRQAAIGTVKHMREVCNTDDINDYYDLMLEAFNVLPPAQPDLSSYSDKLWRSAYERGKAEAQAEIIRCRDCRKYRRLGCPMGITVFDAPDPDGFCSNAERRTDVKVDKGASR